MAETKQAVPYLKNGAFGGAAAADIQKRITTANTTLIQDISTKLAAKADAAALADKANQSEIQRLEARIEQVATSSSTPGGSSGVSVTVDERGLGTLRIAS